MPVLLLRLGLNYNRDTEGIESCQESKEREHRFQRSANDTHIARDNLRSLQRDHDGAEPTTVHARNWIYMKKVL